MGLVRPGPVLAALAACAALTSTPVRADTVERLQWMSSMTDRAAWGVRLAREQMAQNELLEAISTLERVLANHPEEREAHLLHASLLCRVDDPDGAAFEFALLHKQDFAEQLWAEAHAPCPAGLGAGQ